mmetsp:Transcript_12529/g.45691  ORF Transcript_12529/g.45691 Transcript_12529/m.45691 type:complete len:161 (+) Transcript_12529:85-567(+)
MQATSSLAVHTPRAATAVRSSAFRGARVTPRTRIAYCSRVTALQVTNEKVCMQFVKGVDEPCVPEVKLSRAKDGSSGTALFIFDKPSIFQSDSEGEVTGLYLIDEEGTMQTSKVSAKFVNGKPDRVEAKMVMRTPFEWDRFMRFMERYAAENGLGFTSAQ